MRYLHRILLMLSLSLLSGLITASYAHEWHHTKHYTSERLLKLSQQDDFELAHTDFHASASLSSWGSESYYLHIKRELFGLVSCRRTSATDGVLSSDFTPDYFLLIAFSSPPLLELAKQASRLPLDSYGGLMSQRSLYRLSGRKEANLMYVLLMVATPSLLFNFL